MKMAIAERVLVNSPLFSYLHGHVGVDRMLGLARPPVASPILEVGAGQGATTEGLLRAIPGSTIVALEYDPHQAERARRRLGGRARVVEGDATRLAFEDASFGTVVEMNALHHIPDWPAALREIHRVLWPGGQFLFHDYTAAAFFGLFASTSFQPGTFAREELLGELKEAGFDEVVLRGRSVVLGRAMRPSVASRASGSARPSMPHAPLSS